MCKKTSADDHLKLGLLNTEIKISYPLLSVNLLAKLILTWGIPVAKVYPIFEPGRQPKTFQTVS